MTRIGRGTWKGHVLRSSASRVRPTPSRLREAVFSILGGDLSGAVFWDLFCGSGAMGLEALSCRADRSVFVDSNPASLEGIRRFLRERDAVESADLVRKTLPGDLRSLAGPAGTVYIDPPYRCGSVYSWIGSVPWDELIAPGGRLMVEAGRADALPGWEKRRYGSSWLFIRAF